MIVDPELVPVVVAVGQASERGTPVSPLALMERAARAALDEAPGMASRIDRVSVVSVINGGGSAPASALARRLGLRAGVRETSAIGGNSPQWLVNRAAGAIASGHGGATLVAGAEAVRSLREAPELASEAEPAAADPVVGDDRPGLSALELSARLMLPAHVYPLFESVLAARAGRSFEEHRRALAELMAPFTDVAVSHPHAWFRRSRTPDELADPDHDNRVVAEPYTKLMNAFLSVDQGAALVVTSLAVAREAGAAEGAVYVHGGADANDVWFPVERPDLGRSEGLAVAARAALDAARTTVDDVDLLDLYSCFPSAVEMAIDALGLEPDDARGFTVTGGLPYFGGPGNNYSTHAIATMVERLRHEGGRGLVTALGWFVTKHSVGVYGVAPPEAGFRLGETTHAQGRIDATALPVAEILDAPMEGTVEASTVIYDKRTGEVGSVPALVTLDDGRRTAAVAEKNELEALAGVNLVGARVVVEGTPLRFRVEKPPPSGGPERITG
ncbi:MAG TPA: acetyl-CoA acetyltransferase [Acidimicrobiia bacterium]|nr:acetyl-CoA acetyltransferase [Acidimicrobiia bacterium]